MPNREMLENRKHSTAYIPYSFYECRIPEFYLNVPMHWHDEFEINRILRGRGEFICGDDKLTAEEGDLLVLPPDTLHAAYPCDGSAPVLVDVTWDDGQSMDTVGQIDVDDSYFYIPLSSDYEHEADENMASFIQYLNEAARG